jgi:isopenicillin N synthase-like dioxygenase
MTVSTSEIPEIPLISLVRSTPEQALRALSTVGFIHLDLQDTGIIQSDVDRAFELSNLLHSVPKVEKAGSIVDKRGNGYLSIKGSLDERKSKPDLKESFIWGRYKSVSGEFETTQKLPMSLQKYREELIEFDRKCFEASLKVLDMLSKAFEV